MSCELAVIERDACSALDRTFGAQVPSLGWTWRDRNGEHHSVQSMETRHLFYTLRMIWNHSMPKSMRVGHRIRLYTFGPQYTETYMHVAVGQIGRELLQRSDLTSAQKQELREMAQHLVRHPEMLSGPRLALRASLARKPGEDRHG